MTGGPLRGRTAGNSHGRLEARRAGPRRCEQHGTQRRTRRRVPPDSTPSARRRSPPPAPEKREGRLPGPARRGERCQTSTGNRPGRRSSSSPSPTASQSVPASSAPYTAQKARSRLPGVPSFSSGAHRVVAPPVVPASYDGDPAGPPIPLPRLGERTYHAATFGRSPYGPSSAPTGDSTLKTVHSPRAARASLKRQRRAAGPARTGPRTQAPRRRRVLRLTSCFLPELCPASSSACRLCSLKPGRPQLYMFSAGHVLFWTCRGLTPQPKLNSWLPISSAKLFSRVCGRTA